MPESVHDGPARWSDGIAIIGMSARFPQARSVQEFWERLLAGEILISDLTREELRNAGVEDAILSHPDYVPRGSTIEGADRFDAEFFGFSRRDAEIMDPQQRVFLECAWEALEHSGYTGDGEPVGVFAGVGMNTYMLSMLASQSSMIGAGAYQWMLGNDKDYLSTRVAYKLNLRGPAVSVQTACSTSLAAVHLACVSILAGECVMALAGGVSIAFPQDLGYTYVPGMILSPDGYCRPFDAAAGGTVPGRGAGVVVLKRLSQALADEDLVYAVIRGSAWNNDGAGKVGYTAPSVDGQAAVIRQALAAAGTTADRIGFVEAHGTATELGDPIEVAALTSVFSDSHARPGSCVLGAVKANMGHADAAAGIAGLIKAALAAQNAIIPPTPNFRQANSFLALEGGPFFVSASAMPWPQQHDGLRWAGVSSFGIGGTNVHVVLSSAPQRASLPETPGMRIFPISARTPAAVAAACEHLANRIESDLSLAAGDIAATLQLGRRDFFHRRAFLASTSTELAEALRKPAASHENGTPSLAHDVVFLFPGQGQQFPGMAAELYRADPAFRKTVDEGAEILRADCGLDAVECIQDFIPGTPAATALRERLSETDAAQPVLFLVEYALALRWRAVGVEPAALLGHSLGELTAAAVAGVFSFEDALRLAAERGRRMAQTPAGAMLAVMLPSQQLSEYFDQDVWLAAENGPKMSVASGLLEAIEELERKLAADRIASVRLASRNAFHTPLMASAAAAFRQKVESVSRRAPSIPWLSNVTGTWIESEAAQSPQYWGSQILSRVRFQQNLAALAERERFLIEVGPGEALIGIARNQMTTSVRMPSLGAENRRTSDRNVFLQTAATAWECGLSIDWRALQPEARGRRVALPTYPFERQRYWVEAQPSSMPELSHPSPKPASTLPSVASPPTKRPDIASWFYAPSWQSTPPAALALPPVPQAIDCWLVLLDQSPIGKALVAGLRSQGAKVLCVTIGERFAQDGDSFSLHPEQSADYEKLWHAIAADGLYPGAILNLWTMRGVCSPAYDSLVLLLKAAHVHHPRLRQIEVVTDRLESVFGEEIESVERAEALGLTAAIPSEFVGTQCRSIDVHWPGSEPSDPEVHRIAQQILEEIQTSGPGLTVAYRFGSRWQMGWMPAPLKTPSKDPFRAGAVYLITGGTGGIGSSIARYLLKHYQARVIVTGRTALPERSQWANYPTGDITHDAMRRRILRMQELENSGGEVLFVQADVSDRQAMTEAIALAHRKFGPIQGVVHAAGVGGASMISSQDLDEAAAIRRPKVLGSVVLAELLHATNLGTELDFFLLCSSIGAYCPGSSQGAYAAANAFQNYFARYCRKALNLPAIAIGFDVWSEVGIVADLQLPKGLEFIKEHLLRTGIDTAEGIEVIRRVLGDWREPLILVSTAELAARLAVAPQPPAAAPSEKSVAVATPQASDELTAVIEIWKDLLGNDHIQPGDNFFELGGHSLLGTMVAARLRDRFGITLTLRTLFEAATPQALAEVLRRSRMSDSDPLEPASVTDGEREEFEI